MEFDKQTTEIDSEWHPLMDAPAGIIVEHTPVPDEDRLSKIVEAQVAKYAKELDIDTTSR